MSFFDKIKQKLGLKSNNNNATHETKRNYNIKRDIIDVIYSDKTLGITLEPNSLHQPCVVAVVSNSASSQAGIEVGDIVIGIDGNAVSLYADFMSIFPAVGRPVTLR